MPFDRFMIAPLRSGLVTELRPWIIPDDAFAQLENAYVFRGRVKKRFGTRLMNGSPLQSRLAYNIGTVTSHTIPGGATQLQIGQQFSVGADIFTVYQLGAGVLTLSTNPAATATINSTTNPNTVVFTGEPGGSMVLYYPSNPVMGLTQYLNNGLNNQPAYAFDTQFAYHWTNSGWVQSPNTPTFTGNIQQFFWTTNWRGSSGATPLLFVTNFNVNDHMYYFDGTNWNIFQPVFGVVGGVASYVQTAQIIVVFHNRLVLLNTIENVSATNSQYKNRARYSHYATPIPAVVGTGSSAWLEQNQTYMGFTGDGAGFIDATTQEAIISAQFIYDRLIVYFERSTWELVWTNNQLDPFVWQKINTELGSQSVFSTVPFDRSVITIGNTGIHACTGSQVQRIDSKIPDIIFDDFEVANNTNTGVSVTTQICGIRDFINELIYWSYLSNDGSTTQQFPNQILVYNYKNDTWAINDDCFTAYGYFEQQPKLTWAECNFPWNEANFTWESNFDEAQQRQIIAGNQQGFVLIIDAYESRNAPSMQITNMTNAGLITIINHNFEDGDFVLIEDAEGIITYNDNIYQLQVVDVNTINIFTPSTGVYTGGGTAARVSQINILTKQFNPYDKSGRNVYVQKVDFLVDRTENGQIEIEYYASASFLPLLQNAQNTGMVMGNGVLETTPYTTIPFEVTQDRLWHPVYFQTDGEAVQFRIFLNLEQMANFEIATSDFQLHAMTLYTQATTDRLQ